MLSGTEKEESCDTCGEYLTKPISRRAGTQLACAAGSASGKATQPTAAGQRKTRLIRTL